MARDLLSVDVLAMQLGKQHDGIGQRIDVMSELVRERKIINGVVVASQIIPPAAKMHGQPTPMQAIPPVQGDLIDSGKRSG